MRLYKLCKETLDNQTLKNLETAIIYMGTENIKSFCPEHLENKFFDAYGKYTANINALEKAQVEYNHDDIYNYIDGKIISDYCEVVGKISEWVINNNEKPSNYDSLKSIFNVVSDVEANKLKINWAKYKNIAHLKINRELYKKIKNKPRFVRYDMFKTTTGRLSTKKDSFPILTLNKDFRTLIEPNNDTLIELDYNAAEIRTLMSLLGMEQPKYDIHAYLMENVFDSRATRESSKRRLFSWLYDGNKKDSKLDSIFSREKILSKYYNGDSVTNFFKRQISCDRYHALNYLIQSTSSDMVLGQVDLIRKLLKERKSNVYFTMHDSMVIDFSNEDGDLITDIYKLYSDTPLGQFKINVSIGKDFGNMKKL